MDNPTAGTVAAHRADLLRELDRAYSRLRLRLEDPNSDPTAIFHLVEILDNLKSAVSTGRMPGTASIVANFLSDY